MTVSTRFVCPICRVTHERPMPYVKGQDTICPDCRAGMNLTMTDDELEDFIQARQQSVKDEGNVYTRQQYE